MSFKYFKDKQSIIVMVFILAFLIAVVIPQPSWCPYCLLAAAGYALLFYVMRNNP